MEAGNGVIVLLVKEACRVGEEEQEKTETERFGDFKNSLDLLQ